MTAAQQIRDSWGGLDGVQIRGVMDETRSKAVEQGWFDKETTSSPMNSDLAGLFGREKL